MSEPTSAIVIAHKKRTTTMVALAIVAFMFTGGLCLTVSYFDSIKAMWGRFKAKSVAANKQSPITVAELRTNPSPKDNRAAALTPSEDMDTDDIQRRIATQQGILGQDTKKRLPSDRPGTGPDTEKDHITRIADFVGNGDFSSAKTAIESMQIDDGYYYLLEGITLYNLDEYEKAQKALSQAQTRPSEYKKGIREDAVYYWALTLEKMAIKKPNLANKQQSIRAWQQYRKTFCAGAGTSRRCREASGKLENAQ